MGPDVFGFHLHCPKCVLRPSVLCLHLRHPKCVVALQVFCGLLIGAMLPYWFSAMTMKSVGKAALRMVEEVRRQFQTISGLMEGTATPDYKRCVAISTSASLTEMIAPGALVMLTPVIVGTFFGTRALAGVLAGGLVSGVQMAVSMSNTGGAWDNAKKYIEAGRYASCIVMLVFVGLCVCACSRPQDSIKCSELS
jgi:Na+/H+-translocating membrane pyrophosphatase